MKLQNWPMAEPPREKLLRCGAGNLSDTELLAIWLGTGCSGQNVLSLAQDLLQQFGSLRELMNASAHRLCEQRGIGPARYARLQAIIEMYRRNQLERLKTGPMLLSPSVVRSYLTSMLRDRDYEVFCCLFLDNRHHLMLFEELFRGTIDGASVYPREVVKTALAHRAAAVIFAHNHPSGIAEPSHADEAITRRLKDALALVDIRVLDHIVVGDGETVSLAERGLL